ncbi:MAG TPA: RNA polymerase sigma factor [Myxococcales bacterium]|nr:RNA polymerase sigma factor [Myxococcales bacterium]
MGQPAEAEDETALISQVRSGDTSAFHALYETHVDDVFRLAQRLGMRDGEAEDVTQEAFATALEKLDRFEGGEFGHWIRRIATNLVHDRHRKRKVRRFFGLFGAAGDLEPAALEPGPEALAARAQATAHVAAILAEMRPKQREVFALFELERVPAEEIATRLSRPLNTVYSRLRHARQAFVRIGRERGYLEVP